MTNHDEWLTGERTSPVALFGLTALGLVGAVVASQLIVQAATADDTIAATATDDDPDALDSVAGSRPATTADSDPGADDRESLDGTGDGDSPGSANTATDEATGSPSGGDANADEAAEDAAVAQGSGESAASGDGANPGDAAVAPGECPPLFVLQFAVGSAIPDNADPAQAAVLASWLAAEPDVELVLNGHADAAGSEDANLRLSFHRAEAAVGLMIEAGAAPEQLQARGFGEYQPLPGEAPDSERNRRVTMQVPGMEECPAVATPASDAATNDEESNS